jgi:hypothetical protein
MVDDQGGQEGDQDSDVHLSYAWKEIYFVAERYEAWFHSQRPRGFSAG